MRLLGETGREDDGENDNLIGARVPAARLMPHDVNTAYRPRSTINCRSGPADRSESVGLYRTISMAIEND